MLNRAHQLGSLFLEGIDYLLITLLEFGLQKHTLIGECVECFGAEHNNDVSQQREEHYQQAYDEGKQSYDEGVDTPRSFSSLIPSAFDDVFVISKS